MLLTTNNPIEILEVITVLVKNTMVKDVYFFFYKRCLTVKIKPTHPAVKKSLHRRQRKTT